MPLPLLRQLTLASLITFGLTACGGGSSNPEPPSSSSSPSASSEAALASSSSSEGASSSTESSTSQEASSSSEASASSVGTSSVGASSSSEATSSSEAASSSIAPPDLEPAAFSFEHQADVERGATLTSNAITISDIDAPTSISISGGTYAINGGDYVQGEGSVENGDSITLQLIASEEFATESTATLTAGGISGTFTVTTLARDTTPETFSFAPLEEQALEAEVTSGTVTITGINDAADITIENGQYILNGGEPTTEAGQVQNNDTLTLEATAPATAGATQTVTVTVGGIAGVWTVSTLEDTEPPEAAFVFPTPMTMTEAPTVIVRGTATDELSTVTRVTLQVENSGGTTDLDLESDEDFATWQKQVPLTDGENTITVVAEDELGNVLSDGESVTVVRQSLDLEFPDAEMPIDDPLKLVFDETRERVLVGGITDTVIYSVDINTGKRSAFFTTDMAPDLDSMYHAEGLEVTPEEGELLVLLDSLKSEGPGVLRIDLDTKEYEVVLTHDSQPSDQPKITQPTSLRLDPSNSDRAFMIDQGMRSMVSLDLTSGVRTLISNDDFAGPPMRVPTDLLIDAANNRALVVDRNDALYWVDLTSGNRALLLSEGTPDSTPRFYFSTAIVTDNVGQRVLGVDWISHALWSVNTHTGEHRVISGPTKPHAYNELINFTGMDLSEDNEYLIGVDANQKGLFVVDLKTGERVFLSKS